MANLYATIVVNDTVETDKFGAGKHGYSGGDPETPTLPSILTKEFCDGTIGAIMGAVEGSGQAPNLVDLTQLAAAIGRCDLGAFGDGSDGAVVWNANQSLARDFHCTALTISSGAVVSTNGFRIFCQGTVTIDAGCTVQASGADGAAGTGGGAAGGLGAVDGSIAGGAAGGQGGAGGLATAGAPGSATASSWAAVGGSGNGGAGGNVNAGAGGAASAPPANIGKATSLVVALRGEIRSASGTAIMRGGAGGGGGGAVLNGGGGSGGGGGGVVLIAARHIQNSGSIVANGGAGGAGVNGGGGGGGGGGGSVVLIRETYQGGGSGSITTNGGAGGAAPAPGVAGGIGSNGSTIHLTA